MYSFGKEVRDFKEAVNVAIELIETGEFDTFIKSANLDKDFLIKEIKCEESFVLGLGEDIFLDDIFNVKTQKQYIDEIHQRESYGNSCLIVGDCSIYVEDYNQSVICYFLASETFSKSNKDKMLLLSVGFILHDETSGEPSDVKQFVIL